MSGLQGRPEDVIELWTRNGPSQIELLSGDITQLSKDDMVDIAMVSAFTGDYAPMSGTVLGALKKNLGINVMKLSIDKELDLRALFSCWLSKPITETSSPFKKLLCFEKRRGSQLTVSAQISEMFRVFVPVFNNQDHSVITPLLATGHQGHNKKTICGTMVEAAIKWINAGLPLRKFKLVIYEEISDDIRTIFSALKIKYMAKNEIMKKRIFTKTFDVFIMFNPVDDGYMQTLKKNLQHEKEDIKLYANTSHFNEEKVWQDGIFKTMVACKRIVAILSPAFLESTECLEQYNMAMCCNRLLGVDVLAPLYVDTIKSLPSYMGLVQWIDCRVRKDGDTTVGKIQSACKSIIMSIEQHDSGDIKQSALETNNKQQNDKFEFDVFISYSHKNPHHAETLLESFNSIDADCKVFYDRSALTTGTNWQNMLYQSVGECRCFVALISPTYLTSTVCMEEYNLAVARYMCKDKDLMLIPVCIEGLSEVPSYMSTVQMNDASEDYSNFATQLATSVIEWLKLTADKRPSMYRIQEAIDIERILSARRCEDVKMQYKLVGSGDDKLLERITPVVVPKEDIDEIDTTKIDIAVSYANDATNLAGAFCVMLDKKYPNLNMSVYSHGDQQRYNSLDTAKKIVLFISNDFLRNEHHMQELHLALSRQRPLVTNILYLVQATGITGRPFFPRILPYNISVTDIVWSDLEKQCFQGSKNPEVTKVSVFGKRRILEHSNRFYCRRAEYFALSKAVDDVVESFVELKDEKKSLIPMLLNVKAIESASQTALTSYQNLKNGHISNSDLDADIIDGKQATDITNNEHKDKSVTADDNHRDKSANDNPRDKSVTANDNHRDESVTANDNPRDKSVTANDNHRDESVTAKDNPGDKSVTANDNPRDKSVTAKDNPRDDSAKDNPRDENATADDKYKDESVTKIDKQKDESVLTNDKVRDESSATNEKIREDSCSKYEDGKSNKGKSKSCILI